MTDQSKTISLAILGIIAVIAVIGLVLMFKTSATGEATAGIKQVGRAFATKGKATYEPRTAWGGMATGTPSVREGHIFGQQCALLTTQHVADGLIDINDYNNPERGCCATYVTLQQTGPPPNCCLLSCLRAQVNLIPT